jgi:hypothetical protein
MARHGRYHVMTSRVHDMDSVSSDCQKFLARSIASSVLDSWGVIITWLCHRGSRSRLHTAALVPAMDGTPRTGPTWDCRTPRRLWVTSRCHIDHDRPSFSHAWKEYRGLCRWNPPTGTATTIRSAPAGDGSPVIDDSIDHALIEGPFQL